MNRSVWPAPPDEWLKHEMEEDEITTFSHRIKRFRFLMQEFGPPVNMLLMGGLPALYALNDLKRSYIYGNYMAVIMLAQSFVEHSLGAAYAVVGRDEVAVLGFARLIDKTGEDGDISPALLTTLHTLRKMRNPYTHYNLASNPRSFHHRLMNERPMDPDELVVADAEYAIRAVVDYIRHNSPDWTPDTAKGNFY